MSGERLEDSVTEHKMMEPDALEGDLLSVGVTRPDTANRLRRHIAALEATLETAQHEVAEMDAALRVTIPDLEARIHSTCVWCGTPAPQPTTTDTLRAHVSAHVHVCQKHPMRALEAERDMHAQSAETWRKRVEAAAEALADVLPGEVGRLDLLARIAEVKRQRDEALAAREAYAKESGEFQRMHADAHAELTRPSPSWPVAEDEALLVGALEHLNAKAGLLGFENDKVDAAVRRLATKAQGYETLLAVCATVAKSVGFTGPTERLADAVESAMALGRRTLAEYQHAERERIAAVADNSAWREVAAALHRDAPAARTGIDDEATIARWDEAKAKYYRLRAMPDPGATLLEEMETLRQRQTLWEDAATTLYGYAVFIGPCVHDRDPWDRCDECGEESAVHALVKVNNKLREEHRKTTDALEACREHVRQTGEEHRKALVRARNEGLEKAGRTADGAERACLTAKSEVEDASRKAMWQRAADCAADIAEAIRAMAEPEQ